MAQAPASAHNDTKTVDVPFETESLTRSVLVCYHDSMIAQKHSSGGSARDSRAGQKRRTKVLMRAILALDSEDEAARFFADLCTPAELGALTDRWDVVQLVDSNVPYRRIHEMTGVSTATITRVARALVYGENGYRTVLDRQERTKR